MSEKKHKLLRKFTKAPVSQDMPRLLLNAVIHGPEGGREALQSAMLRRCMARRMKAAYRGLDHRAKALAISAEGVSRLVAPDHGRVQRAHPPMPRTVGRI